MNSLTDSVSNKIATSMFSGLQHVSNIYVFWLAACLDVLKETALVR
jgi:hypothetical protein